MNSEFDELIKEIAVKHGVIIGRDDPILVLQTINHRLIEDMEKSQQAMLEQFKSEIELLTLRWTTDIREKSERVINMSLNASKNSMENLMNDAAIKNTTSLKNEMFSILNPFYSQLKRSQYIAIISLLASCINVLIVILILVFKIYFSG